MRTPPTASQKVCTTSSLCQTMWCWTGPFPKLYEYSNRNSPGRTNAVLNGNSLVQVLPSVFVKTVLTRPWSW